jgi:hypothetical protein
MNAGDKTFTNGIDFTLHLSTMKCGATQTDPADHYYLTNAVFANFVGVDEVSNNGITSVSQNYPNPTNGNTTIEVNLTKSSKLSLVVTNLVGQKVYEVNEGTVAAGSHTITIDAGKLNSGVYFYTVNADNISITKKMVIQ